MNVPDIVIYHSKCMDGFTAAWVVWCQYGDYPEYIPMGYDDKIEDLGHFHNKDVLILDFSFKPQDLAMLAQVASSIVILDHHKSAQANLEHVRSFECGDPHSFLMARGDSVVAAFDMNRSGSLMTWHFFHGRDAAAPMLVRLVNDRDLWRFELTGSREVHAWLTSFEFDFETWSTCATRIEKSEERSTVFAEGAAIDRKLLKDMRDIANANSRFMTLGGYPVPVCNMPGHMSSDAGNYLADKWKDFAFSATYYLNGDDQAKFSLRSIGDFDVSAIAAKFGGGGHRNAAGFTIHVSDVGDFIRDHIQAEDHYMNAAERTAYGS